MNKRDDLKSQGEKKKKTLSDFGLNFYQKFRDKPILVIDVRPKNVDFGFVISSSYPHKQTTAASSRFFFVLSDIFFSLQVSHPTRAVFRKLVAQTIECFDQNNGGK